MNRIEPTVTAHLQTLPATFKFQAIGLDRVSFSRGHLMVCARKPSGLSSEWAYTFYQAFWVKIWFCSV
jgi:hypothetical protein